MTEMTYLNPENGKLSMIVSFAPLWYYALGIQIRLQSTDAAAQPGPTKPPNNSTDNSNGNNTQGLSTGIAAAIAIGVTLLVVLIIGGAASVCLFRRRARRRQQEQGLTSSSSPPPAIDAPYETDGQGLPASAGYNTEIDGRQRPAELYPLRNEAAYGSQVCLAPQELRVEQTGRVYEVGSGAGVGRWEQQQQAYELGSHPRSLAPATSVYQSRGRRESSWVR